MDAIGDLLRTLAESVVGLFGDAVRAFGGAIQGVFAALQSILPGLWLPAIVIAVILIVGWNVAKR